MPFFNAKNLSHIIQNDSSINANKNMLKIVRNNMKFRRPYQGMNNLIDLSSNTK